MKVQTFIGKVSIDGLNQMDNHINEWMKKNNVTPVQIRQSFGSNIHHDGRKQEPIIIVSLWYEKDEEEL